MAAARKKLNTRTRTALRHLVELRLQYGVDTGRRRLELLRLLDRRRLPSAREVQNLHELLCFLYAYPDNREVFLQVESMLQAFDRRSDLRRFRSELIDSGIAGTDVYYPFSASTAHWLVTRWGEKVTLDWETVDAERLDRHLSLLALYAESPGLDETPLSGRAWLDRLRGQTTDAEFLVRRMASLPAGLFVRDRVFDELGLMMRLAPGSDTPDRTRARHQRSPLRFQTEPPRRGRPDLRAEVRRPPKSIRTVSLREADVLIDLARGSMAVRSRDLDAFMGASRKDVRLIDCGGGLELACLGVEPERRMLLEAVYGFLMLRNGVPIGYALASALLHSSEIAFNLFDTFRGAEAAHVYGRLLAILRVLFGTDAFTIYPYQLGYGNEEGIASGAWWFYYKLGFRPRDPGVLELTRRELARMRKRPRHRSSPATLRKLASRNLFLELGRPRRDVIGLIPLDGIGLAVTDYLVARFGWDRDRATRVCADEAAELLKSGSWRRFPRDERLAWERLSPLVLTLPGVERWPAADRLALAGVLRAKGGRCESDFVTLFDQHRRLRRALATLGRKVVKGNG